MRDWSTDEAYSERLSGDGEPVLTLSTEPASCSNNTLFLCIQSLPYPPSPAIPALALPDSCLSKAGHMSMMGSGAGPVQPQGP